MSERGWVTLVVRGIGLACTVAGLFGAAPMIFMGLWRLVSPFLGPSAQGTTIFSGLDFGWYLWQGGASVVQIGLGLYLLFGARWLIDRIAGEATGGCRACGYPVDESNPACPECGTPDPGKKTNP